MKNLEQKLVEFLKKHKVLTRFKKNLKDKYCNSEFLIFDDIEGLIDFIEPIPEEIIEVAFDWKLTPEGYEFWEKINKEWRKEVEENESI